MLWRSAGLVALALQVAVAQELSCDFRRPCCWHSLKEDAKWQVRSGRSININEFRRTFLVGRSRLPPVGNYLLQNGFEGQAAFGSCAFCSADGKVVIQYRHWQSPTARLKLCWRRWYHPVRNENCFPAEPSRQSQIISQQIAVPSGKDIQVLFVVERSEGNVNAIVMLDRILVTVMRCNSSANNSMELVSRTARIAVPASTQTTEKRLGSDTSGAVLASNIHKPSSRKLNLSQLALIDDRVKAKILEKERERKNIKPHLASSESKPKELKKQSGEVTTVREWNKHTVRITEELASTREMQTQPALLSSLLVKKIPIKLPKRYIPDAHLPKQPSGFMPPPSPPAKPQDYNPLTDLLGKELVDFLDPNYETKDDDAAEPDYEDEELTTMRSIAPPRGVSAERPGVRAVIPIKRIIPTGPTQVHMPPPLSVFHRQV
ncbi:hypothetical protein Aduo_007201 [Ancylostoma duodenale]